MQWATETDLPAGVPYVEHDLQAASRLVDWLIRFSVYETDADDGPTDPAVLEALRDATVAQYRFWQDTGDSAGAGMGAVSIGSLSLSASAVKTVAAGGQESRIAPEAVQILQTAGLGPQVA